jgi:hypothetical protein
MIKKAVTKRVVSVDGRNVHFFDGAVDFSEREKIYSVVRNSYFKIGNEDADAIESSASKYMCSYYSPQDVDATGIMAAIADTPVFQSIAGLPMARAHVNMSTPSDTHWAHTHKGQIVLLYYINKHWKHDWAGETLFFNDDLSEVECASVYTPGRIIVFDGDIPHSVRPQAASAPTYRFTLSLFFDKHV